MSRKQDLRWALATVLDSTVRELLDALKEELTPPSDAPTDAIAQQGSPLGSRRHCRAVHRRIDHKQGGAWIVGRKYLLTPEALAEELQGYATPVTGKALERKIRGELEQELALLRARKKRSSK